MNTQQSAPARGTAPPDQHHGSCLCGAVRFTVTGTFERFYLCHCSHCRKDSGSAHAANLFSSTARLQWIAGEDHVRRYRLEGTRHQRCFCARCGSALPCAGNGMLVVPAGSLDSPLARRPDAHLFIASRASWDHELVGLPQFDSFPA
ncbi:GFA family protein [Dokdonella sp.]|uniref:GFA family protein n=1 Tax=Dokdonella sp. TaxID=2291710 RepID=UPI0025B95032|nr:GFA family protein [Dokdonella sp.]MBX3689677.1 GFA family protein [Dokdonella sp.]